MSCEKILITGFSGAGKTSFLKEIEFQAPDSDWDFQDLDQLIMKSRGKGHKDLASVIEAHGWEKFRLWERQELEGWLKQEGKGVLALGGGTLTETLLELYQPIRTIQILYVHAPFETCWERLSSGSSEERPLIKLGKERLYQVYLERQKIFNRISLRVENLSKNDLKKAVSTLIKRMNICRSLNY